MRTCVLLCATVFGVLAVPAMARASGNSGPDAVFAEAEAGTAAAMPDAQALVSQVADSASSTVRTASTANPPPPSASAITAAVESEATATVSQALASTGVRPPSGESASPPQRPASPTAPRLHHRRPAHRPRPRAAHSHSSARAAVTTSGGRVTAFSLAVASTRVTVHERHRATRGRSAGSTSHRPAPLPVPPPSPASGAPASGQGAAVPPFVVALAAALLLTVFGLLSRLLPRSAFRKPRRLTLPPWHPG